jgi:hypothetical protein
MEEQRFARSRFTARYWSRRWQVQVWRGGAWVIAWNGSRWYASVGGDPVSGWAVDVLDGGWRSATASLVPLRRHRWRDGFAVVVQHDPVRP